MFFLIYLFYSANEICKSKGKSKIMVHDVLEALNKSGFKEYNKEIEEFIQQLIQTNNDKNKGSKKRNKKTEMENDEDIKNEEVNENGKEKII